MWKVIIINDDFTPVDFVIALVRAVFRRDTDEATRITMEVHRSGAAVAGVYTREIAETKCAVVVGLAREAGHPLMATMEPEENVED
jgi:ATP-dependent Clp protease adaptor protein ClpS